MPLGSAHKAIHLFHASLPPKTVYSPADANELIAKGYGTEYIHQDYPKMVKIGEDKDGNAIQRSVANADEEAALLKEQKKAKKEK